MLLSVIDESKSTFVSNRLIIDNTILAFEAFHWLNTGMRDVRSIWLLNWI